MFCRICRSTQVSTLYSKDRHVHGCTLYWPHSIPTTISAQHPWKTKVEPISSLCFVLFQEVNDKSHDFSCFGAVTHGGKSWMSMYQGAQRFHWCLYITQMRRPNLNWASTKKTVTHRFNWMEIPQQIIWKHKKSVICKMIVKPIVNLIFSDHLQNGNLLQFRECKTTSRPFTAKKPCHRHSF